MINMAKRDKIYMPSGIGGLIRYPEEERVKIKLKPIHVVWAVIAIIIFELILHLL